MPHKGKNKGKRSFNIAAELRELQRNQGFLGIQTHKSEFRGGKIMIEYSNLNETFITFIIKRFPELKEQVEGEMSRLGEFLPHVILGNV